MAQMRWAPEHTRQIVERVVIEGELTLETPAHFGAGDDEDLTDMPLAVDPLTGKLPLLTGSSLAGALRSYLRAWELGWNAPTPKFEDLTGETALKAKERATLATQLFGGFRGDQDGTQSALIIEDALGDRSRVEVREGVRLSAVSRTADDDTLFDLEVWTAGTVFPLRFELVVVKGADAAGLKRALATALAGLANGEITLGARKRRGYGRISLRKRQWRVRQYDLTQPDGLLSWLMEGSQPLPESCAVGHEELNAALGVTTPLPDQRRTFTLKAEFTLDGSLLIRSGAGEADVGPDVVHLCAEQADGSRQPVLTGTSLAGALRARALKIARTLSVDEERPSRFVDDLFGAVGCGGNGEARASRVIVAEHMIQEGHYKLVQNRVKIDRFTGGVLEGALFNEQPVYGDRDTKVTIDVKVLNPRPSEQGLLLLLLKDLWTGDLPLGGESGVGRGRLRGRIAELTLQGEKRRQWIIEQDGSSALTIKGDRGELEDYVRQLNLELRGA